MIKAVCVIFFKVKKCFRCPACNVIRGNGVTAHTHAHVTCLVVSCWVLLLWSIGPFCCFFFRYSWPDQNLWHGWEWWHGLWLLTWSVQWLAICWCFLRLQIQTSRDTSCQCSCCHTTNSLPVSSRKTKTSDKQSEGLVDFFTYFMIW